MLQRYEIEREIKRSDLHPIDRHILMLLCMNLDRGTNVVPPEYAPSVTGLTEGSGWQRRTVTRHLMQLERSGWLAIHRRPGRRSGYAINPQITRDQETPELGTVSTPTRDSGPLIQGDPINNPEIAIVIEEIHKATGKTIDADTARRTRDFILARPRISNTPQARIAYLRKTIAQDQDPARFLPTPAPPRFTKERGFQ
jgi:hypothetical protein